MVVFVRGCVVDWEKVGGGGGEGSITVYSFRNCAWFQHFFTQNINRFGIGTGSDWALLLLI